MAELITGFIHMSENIGGNLRSSGKGGGGIVEGSAGKNKSKLRISIPEGVTNARNDFIRLVSPRAKKTGRSMANEVITQSHVPEVGQPLWDRVPDVDASYCGGNSNTIENSPLFNADCVMKEEGRAAKFESVLRNRILLLLDSMNPLGRDTIERWIRQPPDVIERDPPLKEIFLKRMNCTLDSFDDDKLGSITSIVRALENMIMDIVSIDNKPEASKLRKVIRCYEALDRISSEIRTLEQQWGCYRKWHGGDADSNPAYQFVTKRMTYLSQRIMQAVGTVSLPLDSFPRIPVADVVSEFNRQCGNLSTLKTDDAVLGGFRTALGNFHRNIRACWPVEFNGDKELLVLWRKDFAEAVYRGVALGIADLDERMMLDEIGKFRDFRKGDPESIKGVQSSLEGSGPFRMAVMAVSSAPKQIHAKLKAGRVQCSPELRGILDNWIDYCEKDENARILKDYKGTGCMNDEKLMPMSNDREEAVKAAIRKGREFQRAFLSEFKFTEAELHEYFDAECKAKQGVHQNDPGRYKAAISNLERKHAYALRECLPGQFASD